MGYGTPDEISEVIGDPRFAQNYYPSGLKEVTVGAHSLDMVSVSRYYFLATPKVIVDFEPSPLDGKMWQDEKRQWCYAHGVAYVPVLLSERLTKELFKQRVEQELHFLKTGAKVMSEAKALALVTVEEVIAHLPPDRTVTEVLAHPASQTFIDQETLKRFDARYASNVNGGARANALKKLKAEVIAELRERIKHGRMGSLVRDQQPAVAARG